MTYVKQQWVDGQTKVDAQHLNHIEQGIYAISIQPGVPGEKGEQGEPGKDGTNGITPLLKVTDTNLQVSYDNGSQWSDLLPLSAITGPQGQTGEGFAIYKTYASIAQMEADAANVEQGKFVLISSGEADPDNGKLYVKGESAFTYLSDLSGAQGIQGPQGEPGANGVTPVITVTAKSVASSAEATVIKSGTDTNPSFEFSIPRGKDAELPDNLVTYSDFTYGDQQRKTIQLANYDSISGIGTDGQGYNIAMVSKWDKVDLGTPSLTMNLNSLNGEVQINDEKIVATVDQIPDVSNFVSQDTLASELATKQDAGDYALKSEIPDISGLATKQELTQGLASKQDVGNYALKSEIPDVSDFATHTEVTDGLATKQDKGDYATNEVVQAEFESYDKTIKAYVDSKLTAVYTYKGSVANEQALPTQDQTVGDVYNVEDTGKNVAWDGEKWDELGATVDLSAYAKTEDVNAQLATKANQTQVDTLASDVNNIGNVIIPEMNTNTAKALATKVDWDAEKKVISLPMDGSISALRNAETLEGGVLIAQRSYDEQVTFVTEVGTTKNKLTLNASERPQIDIAGGSSEKVAYVSDIPSTEGLATETALTEGLAGKAETVHTHEIADVTGLQAILDLMPVEIKLPIRTGIGGFQDKLYTQEEIFAWFGVTDLSGFLALAKSTRQVWISYVVSASFQTSAYRYLANYIEYVPSSQSITVIWVGPDSANADIISKFVFKANLDQTVISGASNVQLTVTSIE